MRYILFSSCLLLLAACGGKDPICACIESGNKLNNKANEILQNGSTAEREKELKALKADKNKKCAEFTTMDGEQMRKRMQDCQ